MRKNSIVKNAYARSGQSLVEILVAAAIGVIVITGGLGVLVSSFRIHANLRHAQVASGLAKELFNAVSVVAESDWDAIDALATTSVNRYYIVGTSSPFSTATGTNSVIIGEHAYTRSFYVDDVMRNGSGRIDESGLIPDPSTKKITIQYSWPPGDASSTLVYYLARFRNNVFVQNDWSAGAGIEGPINATGTARGFSTSSNVVQGSIVLGTYEALGVGDIDPNIHSGIDKHWAWNDLIGWIDFYINQTVKVTSNRIYGYASSSAGDISLDCSTTRNGDICAQSNYYVTNDGTGNLSGWGWNDVYGWISFDCNNYGGCAESSYRVYIDGGGEFNNWAWSDAAGWISFTCANYQGGCSGQQYTKHRVITTWRATSESGSLESSTINTGSQNSNLNSVLWQGSQPLGTTVRFQFAVSNSSGGPWNYKGPDGTSASYYVPDVNVSAPLDYSLHGSAHYFRYKVDLLSDIGQTASPRVDELIINWSP